MRITAKYILDLFKDRKLIFNLALNDCKARFSASTLGMVWAFIQPLMTVLVFWFVFQVGLRSRPVSDTPFIVWFTPAYLIWAFFSEGLSQTTNSLIEYKYLIKKVNFKVQIIPPIKIVASGIIHLAFILFICLLNAFYRYSPSVYYFQVFYYFICTALLLLGMGWLFAALNVFVKDISNIVSVALQLGFWATPIFWNPDELAPGIRLVLKLNPVYYICAGYRETFINEVWFWEHRLQTAYFWLIVLFLLWFGTRVFHKFKPLFDDAL